MNGATKSALLQSRAVLRLGGPDRFSFLQGLVCQDMRLAEAGKPVFAALLTPQGKYLFDFFVVPEEDYLLLDCQAAQVNEFVKRLYFYKMRSAVALEDTRAHYAVFGLWHAASGHPRAYADTRFSSAVDERLIIPKNLAGEIHTTHDEEHYREHRYKSGIPEGFEEIEVGQATLLELNFDMLNAISWEKGCYIGQEVTARTRYRGTVKKRYLPFTFEGQPPEKHQDIMYDGFAVGRVMAIGERYGLGLFNLEKIRPFVEDPRILVYNGTSYQALLPPYLKAKGLTALLA